MRLAGTGSHMRALDRVDAAIGGGIEHAMIHHHMRRMRRHGQLRALAPGLRRACGRRPRCRRAPGNSMEVLIDGANALPRMAEAIQRRQAPRPRVLVAPGAGLRSRPADGLAGQGAAGRGRRARARARDRVGGRAGAGLPAPPRRRARPRASGSCTGTKIQCQLDSCTRLMHCHHEKLVIVDDELAFVGGIDLTTLAGDRYDTNEHPHKDDAIGWHDASAMLRGPIVRRRRRALRAALGGDGGRGAGAARGASPTAGDTTVQFVRTVPEGAYRVLPRGEFSVLETYVRALRSAQRLIYLENQFLWSPEIVHILETKLRNPPSHDFRVVVLLPHKANNGQDDTRGMLGAARRRRRRPQELPRRHDHVALGREVRPAVRARQDRHRRRRVARDRLRQPQRALAVQRHRGRRRHLRPGAGPRDAGDAVGGAPGARRRVRRPGARWSTSWRPIASEQLERQRGGRAADAPPRRAAGRVPPLAAAARAARRARGRRLRRRPCGCRARARGRRGAP